MTDLSLADKIIKCYMENYYGLYRFIQYRLCIIIYNQVIKQIKNRYAFICKVYRLEMLNMLIYIHDEGVNSRSCWRLF